MPLTETIVWHPASEPPSDDRTVQLRSSSNGGEEPGYWNGDDWFDALHHYRICGVAHWSEKPRGPAAEGGAK